MSGWTIQSLIDGNMMLTAHCYCSDCRHSQILDLERLKAQLGPDAPAMADDLMPRLRCSNCGGKNVGMTYSPDPNKTTGMGVSSYAKAKGV